MFVGMAARQSCVSYKRMLTQPHFLQYKKNSKNYYVPLASAGASRPNRIPGSSPISRSLIGLAKTSFRADYPRGWPGTRFEQTVFKTP